MTDSNNTDNEKSRVLVCDDSKLVRFTAKKILGERFDLVLLEDGQQAWEKIVADPKISVVFTDLGMPNLDGYGLIEKVRASKVERIRNLPMIVITGASEDEKVKKRIYDLGATDFVSKPFTPTAIIARAEAHTNYIKINHDLQNNVNTDLVTKVLNCKGFNEKLTKDLSFVKRHKENLAVAIFDLANFGDPQNTAVFNHLLKSVASLLSSAIRKEDSIARETGNDGFLRFMISFPMAKTDGVIALSRRLCAKINEVKFKSEKGELNLVSSVGIAAIGRGQDIELPELVGCAERALDNAKALGPGEVQFLKVEDEQGDEEEIVISIDDMLEHLALGKPDSVIDNMDAIIYRLSPILSLLTREQKERLFLNQH